MNDEQLTALLLAVEALDERESVIRQRLLYQEKVDILVVVQQHGAGAIATLTKGGRVIYDREAGTTAGPDQDFLDWAIFRSPPGTRADGLIYDGPETIQLLVMDHSYPGRAVIGSYFHSRTWRRTKRRANAATNPFSVLKSSSLCLP